MDGTVGEMKYSDYYRDRLEVGLEYQDFIADLLFSELFIPISTYQSRKYQLRGENKQGIEIKFDDRYRTTGNLYFEIAEKSDPSKANYFPSGVYRDDNTWLYIIGDYAAVFIFGKRFLIELHKTGKCREVETPTSRGFLLPISDGLKYALRVIKCDETKNNRPNT